MQYNHLELYIKHNIEQMATDTSLAGHNSFVQIFLLQLNIFLVLSSLDNWLTTFFLLIKIMTMILKINGFNKRVQLLKNTMNLLERQF